MTAVRFATGEPVMEKVSFENGGGVHAPIFTSKSRMSLDC
jgi:hypothetical protein